VDDGGRGGRYGVLYITSVSLKFQNFKKIPQRVYIRDTPLFSIAPLPLYDGNGIGWDDPGVAISIQKSSDYG